VCHRPRARGSRARARGDRTRCAVDPPSAAGLASSGGPGLPETPGLPPVETCGTAHLGRACCSDLAARAPLQRYHATTPHTYRWKRVSALAGDRSDTAPISDARLALRSIDETPPPRRPGRGSESRAIASRWPLGRRRSASRYKLATPAGDAPRDGLVLRGTEHGPAPRQCSRLETSEASPWRLLLGCSHPGTSLKPTREQSTHSHSA